MQISYKAVLSSRTMRKEVELSPRMNHVTVGTEKGCDIRLRKDLFLEPVVISFQKQGEDWSVSCADSLYLKSRGPAKRETVLLHHSDLVEVRYKRTGTSVFDLHYRYDFEKEPVRYDRYIDLGDLKRISVGTGEDCLIRIEGGYAVDDLVILEKEEDRWLLTVHRTSCGVYHNQVPVVKETVIYNRDFLSVSGFFFQYANGFLRTEKKKNIRINDLRVRDIPDRKRYPKYFSNVRLKRPPEETGIEIMDPPKEPERQDGRFLMRLFPSFAMLAGAGIMAMQGGTSMMVFSGISAGTGLVSAAVQFVQEKKKFKRLKEERREKYSAYIRAKRDEICEKRNQERLCREEMYLPLEQVLRNIDQFSPALFDRSEEDSDFLCARLGTGRTLSCQPVLYKSRETLETKDDLMLLPESLCEEYRYLPDSPVVLDLKNGNAAGICGEERLRFLFLKNLVTDLAARQDPSGMKLFFIAEEGHRERISWLRMLPHVFTGEESFRGIVTDEEGKAAVFEYLFKELSSREQNGCEEKPWLVIIFYDECGFFNHPLSRFVRKAEKLQAAFLFLAETEEEILKGCRNLIRIEDENTGSLIPVENARETIRFSFPAVPDETIREAIRLLSPVYREEISLASMLTGTYSLYEMLAVEDCSEIDLGQYWDHSRVYQTLAAPVGISGKGVVYLDLHEKAHGPHGLVAGTTGSGKSELLQTFLLSMAVHFHPHDICFVIIDFKGGGMAGQLKELPHLAGTITNIDGKAISRSLRAIRAELLKRQRLFDAAGVNHIDRYIRQYKKGILETPLPHLIIIVDEFAELKADQPEFMKELISAARIGRSLGVHLILATQKPSGQVDEQIWSNSRLRLCLKVQDAESSNEVLKSPLAAEIREPGRAYMQVGNNEVFELFQSAFSGAPAYPDRDREKGFPIYRLSDSGKRELLFEAKAGQKKNTDALSQMEAVARHIRDYCEKKGIRKIPDICCPPLADIIPFPDEEDFTEKGKEYLVPAGIYDDPDRQYQGLFALDLSLQNLFVIGAAQSGKTNLLKTLIRGVTMACSPEEVRIYILDFASTVLRSFEDLPHVKGVVCPADDEKLANLMRLLTQELDGRKKLFAETGIGSFRAFREAGRKDLPLILVVVDNLSALKEMYFQDDSEFLYLLREGLSAGIAVLAASQNTMGIGYRYLSFFAGRIALFCNDANEYAGLLDHCRDQPDQIPGRCLVEYDRNYYECQTFLAFSGEREIDRIRQSADFIRDMNRKYPNEKAGIIPQIPEPLTREFLLSRPLGPDRGRFDFPAGLDYESVKPVLFRFSSCCLLSLLGNREAVRGWTRFALKTLRDREPESIQVYVSDGIGKELAFLKEEKGIKAYSTKQGAAAEYLIKAGDILKERYKAAEEEESELKDSSLLLLIFNNMEALEQVEQQTKALQAFRDITGKYRNLCVGIFLLCMENTEYSFGNPEVVMKAKRSGNVLFFDDLKNLKVLDPPVSVLRKFGKPLRNQDAFFVRNGDYRKLKTVFD